MKAGWEIKRLGDVVTRLTNGYVGPTREIYLESGVPYLLARHVKNNQLIFDGKTFVSDEFNQKNKKSMLKAGDVLLVQSGHIGHSAVVTEEHEGHNCHAMIVITPVNDMVSGYFLSLFFNSPEMQSGFENIRSGSTVPHLTCKEVKEIAVPLPPLPEQQRIVAILDEAFEGIASAKANAEKNLHNARALFDSHLQAVFSQRGEGWVETTIGQQIRFIDYRGKTPEKTESGLRLITAKNVKMGYMQKSPMEFVAPESYDSWMTRGIPKQGDVLFTTEAPLANVAQLDTNEKVVFAQRIIIMQTDAAKLDSTFLKYLLLSQPVQQRILAKGTGATVQGIKASLLKTIEISFPKTVAEQLQIVEKLDALREETQRLESIYQQKLNALDALKKSLLDQAFRGEL